MDIATALSVAVEENAITKEGVKTIAEALMKNTAVPEEGLDVESTPSKIEELKSALMSAIDADANIISKEDLKSVVSAEAMAAEETGATRGEAGGGTRISRLAETHGQVGARTEGGQLCRGQRSGRGLDQGGRERGTGAVTEGQGVRDALSGRGSRGG
jgi:hypothetical protein